MVQRVTRKGKERKVIYLIRTYIHNARIRAKIEDSFGKKKKKKKVVEDHILEKILE